MLPFAGMGSYPVMQRNTCTNMYTWVSHVYTRDLVPVMCFFLTEQTEGNSHRLKCGLVQGLFLQSFAGIRGGSQKHTHAHVCARCSGSCRCGHTCGTPHVAMDPAGRPATTRPEHPEAGFEERVLANLIHQQGKGVFLAESWQDLISFISTSCDFNVPNNCNLNVFKYIPSEMKLCHLF